MKFSSSCSGGKGRTVWGDSYDDAEEEEANDDD